MKKLFSCTMILAAIFIFNSCGSDEIVSKWADKPVVIDGSEKVWQDKTTYLKDEGLLFGVQNDKDNFYLFLSTSDQSKIRQMLGRGLIVWFDAEGGSNKKFGIKYPVGAMASGDMPPRTGDEDPKEIIKQRIDRLSQEFELYEPDSKTWTRMSFAQVKGIEGKITRQDDRVVYEIKISRTPQNSDFFIASAGNKIGLGLETPEFDLSKMRERLKTEGAEGGQEPQAGSGMGGGGRRGGGRGGEGRGGGGRRPQGQGQGGENQKQLKYWVTVNLANNP